MNNTKISEEYFSGEALYFCRTPLQLLIAQKLISQNSSQSTLLYHPTSLAGVHKVYFDKIIATRKVFIPWSLVSISYTLRESMAILYIPRYIRKIEYKDIYIASIGSIPFCVIAANNPKASIHTFDDGTFNLNNEVFQSWIDNESWPRRMVKFILRGKSNKELIKIASCHYTIFDPNDIVGIDYQIKRVNCFPDYGDQLIDRNNKRIRVLLGTIIRDDEQRLTYESILDTQLFDVFLPHPRENREIWMKPWVREFCEGFGLESLIAEDAVFHLRNKGLVPKVYGFGSTALLTLSRFVETINIELFPAKRETSIDAVFRKSRIKNMRIKDSSVGNCGL